MLSRHLGAIATIDAAQYVKDGDGVVVCCPCCKTSAPLTEMHTVDPAGYVTPIYACPNAACPFAEFLFLDGLDGEP